MIKKPKTKNKSPFKVNKDKLLKYKNKEVISKFCKNHGFTNSFGEIVFKDLMKYLYLGYFLKTSQKKQLIQTAPIISGMAVIDEMWHTFIQYTKEYEMFCDQQFGHFVHHEPERVLKTKKRRKISNKEFEAYCEMVWDLFGESVVLRWFREYPKKYSHIKLKKLQFKSLSGAK